MLCSSETYLPENVDGIGTMATPRQPDTKKMVTDAIRGGDNILKHLVSRPDCFADTLETRTLHIKQELQATSQEKKRKAHRPAYRLGLSLLQVS